MRGPLPIHRLLTGSDRPKCKLPTSLATPAILFGTRQGLCYIPLFSSTTSHPMRGRRYSLVIADRQTGAVRRFTVALWPVIGAVVAVYSLPILIGLGARWSARSAIDQLQASNAALQVENASYREATGQLADQVAALQTAVNELGDHAVVDPAASRAMERLPAIVKSRAMGGSEAASLRPMLSSALGAPDSVCSASSTAASNPSATASSDATPWPWQRRRSGRSLVGSLRASEHGKIRSRPARTFIPGWIFPRTTGSPCSPRATRTSSPQA